MPTRKEFIDGIWDALDIKSGSSANWKYTSSQAAGTVDHLIAAGHLKVDPELPPEPPPGSIVIENEPSVRRDCMRRYADATIDGQANWTWPGTERASTWERVYPRNGFTVFLPDQPLVSKTAQE